MAWQQNVKGIALDILHGLVGKYRKLSVIIAWPSGCFGIEGLMVIY